MRRKGPRRTPRGTARGKDGKGDLLGDLFPIFVGCASLRFRGSVRRLQTFRSLSSGPLKLSLFSVFFITVCLQLYALFFLPAALFSVSFHFRQTPQLSPFAVPLAPLSLACGTAAPNSSPQTNAQIVLLRIFTSPSEDERDAVHRLHVKAQILRISGFQTTGLKAPQSKGPIMQSAAKIFRERDLRMTPKVFHNIRNALPIRPLRPHPCFRYDGHIGKGHAPQPQSINHSAAAGFRRGVGGNSSWHGDGTSTSEIRVTHATARLLNRLRRLRSETSPLLLANHPTPPCWPLSGFWRDRRRATRHIMTIPQIKGDRP